MSRGGVALPYPSMYIPYCYNMYQNMILYHTHHVKRRPGLAIRGLLSQITVLQTPPHTDHIATTILFSRRITLKIFQARNLEASSLSASGGVFAASEAGRAVEEGRGQAWQDPRLRLQLRAEQVPFSEQIFLGPFLLWQIFLGSLLSIVKIN